MLYINKKIKSTRFLFVFGSCFIMMSVIIIKKQSIKNYIDTKIKSLICSQILNNKNIYSLIAISLVDLVNLPKIKSLMTELFIIMLHNKGFIDDTTILVRKLILDYIRSEDCKNDLSKIIINEVLKNPDILKEIHLCFKVL